MSKTTEQRFWEKVDKSGDCWLWRSGTGSNGYGSFWFNRKICSAHRVAYELTYGEIPKELIVCHSCDCPLCVNPSHLWIGTVNDNIQDMVTKQRQRGPTKLTGQSVITIRRLYANKRYSQAQLGKIFGVQGATIGEVVRREIWKHI